MDVILFPEFCRIFHQLDCLLPTGKLLVHVVLLELLDATRTNREKAFTCLRVYNRIYIAKTFLSANACSRMGFVNLATDYLPLASGSFAIVCNRKLYHGSNQMVGIEISHCAHHPITCIPKTKTNTSRGARLNSVRFRFIEEFEELIPLDFGKTMNAMTVVIFVHVIVVVKPKMPARSFARSDVCGLTANVAGSL